MDLMLGKRLRELPGPIMITGHTGFKGCWITFLLEWLNIPVIGLSLPPQRGSLFDRAKRSGSIPEAFVDIRDPDGVREFIGKYQPSAVIHMAAQPLVLESYRTPRETFETNVMGTVNILSSAFQEKSVKAVVVVTTDKVYKNDNLGRAFVETDPLSGKDPYSASKVGAEAVVVAWQQIAEVSGGPKVISVRAGNVIGGGDWAENRLIPDLIRGLIAGGPIQIRNPKSTRPWQHVLDPLCGYLLALEAILDAGDFRSLNFGPDSESLSVQEVVEIGVSAWPREVILDFNSSFEKESKEAIDLQLNSSKARNLLGWKPHWTQREAIAATIEWWNKNLNGLTEAKDACSSDISNLFKNDSFNLK